MSSPTQEFGRLRSFLWPVYRHEHRRFLPMLFTFFLICFNYNILRATKDSLVVTARASGAEAIPFIKVWAILPAALLMTWLFSRMCNKYSREKVFYIMMGIFLGFFAIFAFFIYPFREMLHPHQLADQLQEILPIGCKGLIAMFRNWTYTAFYIMSEMWSTIVMTVLFWGFANEVTSVKDAKRFYGLLGISANFSGVVSGQVSTWMSKLSFNSWIPYGTDSWDQALLFLNIIVILAGITSIYLFRWLHREGYGYSVEQNTPFSKSTDGSSKMSLRKNFSYLAKSPYLICIAVIVVTYNVCINLVEVVWKDQVKELYPNPAQFNAYMGQVHTATGALATLISIFVSSNVLRRFSWTASAMISPVVVLITGVGFFSFLLLKNNTIGTIAAVLGSSPLAFGVFFGSLQNCFARASKYTLFDSTKELAFVPLSRESRLKGKAAIDGVGSRLGKSGGSLTHQGLLMMLGTVSSSIPYVASILLVSITAWIWAVKSLGKKFVELEASQAVPVQTPEAVPQPVEQPALQ